MSMEDQSENGVHSISRLRRTFSLPLSKIKMRSNSFKAAQTTTQHTHVNVCNDRELKKNGHAPKARFWRNHPNTSSLRVLLRRKDDVRVSKLDPDVVADGISLDSEDTRRTYHSSRNGYILPPIEDNTEVMNDTYTEYSHRGHKKTRKRARMWPTQTIARVLEGGLKRIQISKKYRHAGFVIRTVIIPRVPGDTLGIYIRRGKHYITDQANCYNHAVRDHDKRSTIVISRLAPGSVSEKQGRLKRGDEILFVNDTDVSSMPLMEVATIMDYQEKLVLVVRSKHIGINNNIDGKLHLASSQDNGNISCTGESPETEVGSITPTDGFPCQNHNCKNLPTTSQSSLTPPDFSRGGIIPSVYDNNYNVTSTIEVSTKPEKRKVERDYEEAYQILINAINSFDISNNECQRDSLKMESYEPQQVSKKSEHEDSRPQSYWNLLSEIMSHEDQNRSSNPPTMDLNPEACNSTPLFPNISEELAPEEPDYDEVSGSDVMETDSIFCAGEELGVDGYGKLYNSHNCEYFSSSSHVGEGCQPVELRSISSSSSSIMSTKLLSQNECLTENQPLSSQQTGASKIIFKSISDSSKQERPTCDDQEHDHTKACGVTVAQRKGWFSKGAQVSVELQQRIEGGNCVQSDHFKMSHLPSSYDSKKLADSAFTDNPAVPPHSNAFHSALRHLNSTETITESRISNPSRPEVLTLPKVNEDAASVPSERSPKSLYQISPPVWNQESLVTETQQGSREGIPLQEGPSNKHFWSKITSPPRVHKNRFGRKITKRMKRFTTDNKQYISEGTTNDMTSDISECFGVNDNKSSILDKYHLEPGQRRLSRQFLPDSRSSDPSVKLLELSDFKKYKPSMLNTHEEKYSQHPIKGSLIITLYGARDFKKIMSEVYCVAQVDDEVKHRIRTPMKPCRGSVAWNECYEAKLEEAYELHITLYTWETHGKHKTLAKSTLPIANILSKVIQGTPVRLAVKLEPKGTLYIKLSLEDASTLAGPKVFGADLQSILNREQCGLQIPLLVSNCIKEVEARGMSVVGIYRLCGSAIAKKELRRAYEENSEAVDLSLENYPDVNVITGILKDFLRELPQPLFPPELLEAVTAAMENSTMSLNVMNVSSPFEPTPGIELSQPDSSESSKSSARYSNIFNLLENEEMIHLPVAERATLYALLNHLKKVSSYQDQNKMTCQNLAVCFGPVLLGSMTISPSKGLDLTAAIGFKRHIQVLNYMVSNWPKEPVPLTRNGDIPEDLSDAMSTSSNTDSRRTSYRMSRVSLTRRLSYALPSQSNLNASIPEDMDADLECRTNSLRRSALKRSESLKNILDSQQYREMQNQNMMKEDVCFHHEDDFVVGYSRLKENSIE